MAVTKITWENKEGIQNDESIARKNKVMDDDMNEIKQVVNNNADELNIAQSNIEDLQSGQGTANTDITNLKSRVSTLETDNTTNKSNIQQLQNNQQETETNVETLQEKVTTLETDNTQNKSDINALKTDNETNKSNISTLQEEQLNQNTNIENLQENDTTQDELIEKLQQENENIKNALINEETEQAKSLHIEDASTVSAKLEVEGNAEQETQEGTDNLAILEEGSTTKSGVTVSIENGNITTNGQNETESTLTFEVGKVYLIEGETYYIKRLGVISYTGIYVNNNKTQVWGSEEEKSFVANKTGNFGIVLTVGQTATNNLTQQILISKTSGAEWVEGKVQIPSPINPSKVKCLGSNKNYFNKDTVTQNKYLSYQNEEIENNSWTYTDYIECKPNEDWIISGYTTIGGAPGRCFYDKNKNYITGGAHNNQESMMKFTIPDNCYYFRDSIAKADIDTVKIEQNNVATSYSPYGQGSTEIQKINKNFAKIDTVNKTTTRNGVTITIDEDGTVTLNGTATTNFYLNMIDITDYSSVNMKNYSLPKKNYKAYFELIAKNNSQTNETNGDINFYYRNIAVSSTGEQAVTYAQFIRIIQGNVGVTVKDFQITDDTIVSYMYITAGVVLDNLKFRFAILDENETNTDYEEHQQENDILPIQQEMFPGDCWTKEEDGWKEVHSWITVYNKDINSNIDNIEDEQHKTITTSINLPKKAVNEKPFSNILTYENNWEDAEHMNLSANLNVIYCIYNKSNFSELTYETIKETLEKADGFIKYKTEEPTKLACTEEQSAVLDKLNNLDLFKNTNNIITTEDIALLKLNYVVDTKTYVDNKIANMQEELDTINQLLSTTQTSSILLDNLQTDLEGEVM